MKFHPSFFCTVTLAILATFASVKPCRAALGETFDQMQARYGATKFIVSGHTKSDDEWHKDWPGLEAASWTIRDSPAIDALRVDIHADFLNGVCVYEDFLVTRYQANGTTPETYHSASVTFSPDEIATLLEGNRQDSSWTTPPNVGLSPAVSKHLPPNGYCQMRDDGQAIARVVRLSSQPQGPGAAWVTITTPEYLRYTANQTWRQMSIWETLWCLATGAGPEPTL